MHRCLQHQLLSDVRMVRPGKAAGGTPSSASCRRYSMIVIATAALAQPQTYIKTLADAHWHATPM